MIDSLYIGELELVIDAPCRIRISEDLIQYHQKVLDTKKTVTYKITFGEPEPLPFTISARLDLPPQLIGKTQTGEARFYPEFYTGKPLALYQETGLDFAVVKIYSEEPEELIISLEILNYFAVERQLIRLDSMILHSSFIVQDKEGVLFTAPSGTGKSTQAELWETYANAKIMNGDRTLLVKTEDGWRAVGFPFSGSSGINHNGCFRIKGITMIYQAKENSVNQVGLLHAFKKIYPEIVRNYWDQEYENKVMNLLEDVISEVPCFALGCNISEEAVLCLKAKLSQADC